MKLFTKLQLNDKIALVQNKKNSDIVILLYFLKEYQK